MPAEIWLLVFSLWTVHGETAFRKYVQLLFGVALLTLSYPRGRIRERYAGWDRFLL